METLKIIESRCSTRSYLDEKMDQKDLETILNAGLMAPTATNRQEIHFSVLRKGNPVLTEIEDEKNRLRNMTPPVNFYYDADAVIIVSGEDGFRFTEVDAGIAVENMALAAEDLGYGNVIVGCIKDALNGEKKAEFDAKLNIPEGYSYKIALAVGKRKEGKIPHLTDQSKVSWL